jgi:hypothetical protein
MRFERSNSRHGSTRTKNRAARQLALRSVLFFVLVPLFRELHAPNVLLWLDALSAELLLLRLRRGDPEHSESRPLVAILKLNHVLRFQLASKTSQPYAMIGDVQRMGQMALLISICSSDPQFHWRDHSGSLLPPLAFDKSRHVELRIRLPVGTNHGARTNIKRSGIYHTTHCAL